jgi:O-antigen ligase
VRLTGRQRIAAVVTLALIVSAVLLFAPATSWERLSTVPNELERGTLTGRTLIWSAGWELFREHPLLGVGANAFRLTVSRVLAEPIRLDDPSPAPPAHNTFLSVLVEQGIVGLALFLALIVSLVVSLWAAPLLSRQLWLVCLAVWAIGVSDLTWEMRKPTWFFFGLLVAHAAASSTNGRALHYSQSLTRIANLAARPLKKAISLRTNYS